MKKTNTISSIKEGLESWEILLSPTDTCYWFSCPINSHIWIKRIQEIKKRQVSKPFSILFSSITQAKKYCQITKENEDFILSHRGKSSFIVKKKEILNNYFPEFNTVSIRIENEDFVFKAATFLWEPVTSTSVNITNMEILNTKQEILNTFWKYPFINFQFFDNFKPGKASTIWDLSSWEAKIIRK